MEAHNPSEVSMSDMLAATSLFLQFGITPREVSCGGGIFGMFDSRTEAFVAYLEFLRVGAWYGVDWDEYEVVVWF